MNRLQLKEENSETDVVVANFRFVHIIIVSHKRFCVYTALQQLRRCRKIKRKQKLLEFSLAFLF